MTDCMSPAFRSIRAESMVCTRLPDVLVQLELEASVKRTAFTPDTHAAGRFCEPACTNGTFGILSLFCPVNRSAVSAGNRVHARTVTSIRLTPRRFRGFALERRRLGRSGVNMQAASRAPNRYFEPARHRQLLQLTTVNNIRSTATASNGSMSAASSTWLPPAVSLDYYPLPNHGFRLSPGVMLYNKNQVSAGRRTLPGGSAALHSTHTTYYSAIRATRYRCQRATSA